MSRFWIGLNTFQSRAFLVKVLSFESGMFDLRCLAFYVQSSVRRYFMFSRRVLHASVFLLLVPVEVSLLLLSVGQTMECTPWLNKAQ